MEELFFKRLKRSSAEIDAQISTMEKKMKVCRSFKHEFLQKDALIVTQDSERAKIIGLILEHLHSQLMLSTKELVKNAQNIKETQVEIRDQGFTKPKVLLILPFKSNAFQFVQDLIQISGIKQVKNKARFLEEYSCQEEQEFKDKPQDFIEAFSGNIEDCFRIGIKFSKKQIGLYSNFYSSDLIIGSPLGLRMVATQKNKELNFDFLSGINILVMDKSEILLMQNWEHVLLIFNNLNLIPKVDHGADFSRIRDWVLDGKSKYFRQNIILSKFSTLELNNLMNNYCFNADGKNKICPIYNGSILTVVGQIPQVFYRFDSKSIQQDPEARFKFFLERIMSNVKVSALLQSQTLIFIHNYFDFTRLRSYFKEQELLFAKLSEYTSNQDISRARGDFFHGNVGFLLMTERFHFFKRYKIRGIKNIIFYGLPMHDHFYSELVNSIENPQDATIISIYSKYDKMSLERVVGSKSVERMVDGEKDSFMYS